MGLFKDIAGLGKDVGKGAFRYTLKPAGKTAWRGLKEYDERVLDPLGALAIQQGSELNKQTFVLDFKRLSQGKQPFVHGRRTFFDEEITPRDIDVNEIMFGSGTSRRRERKKARATFEEAGLVGEILAKTAIDPFNVFVAKSGTIEPTYRGIRGAYRGVKGVLTKPKVAAEAAPRFKTTPYNPLREDYASEFADLLAKAPSEPVTGGRTAAALADMPEMTIPDAGALMDMVAAETAMEARVLASVPARPLRFVTNRFVGSANTAKAETIEAMIPLEAAKFEHYTEATNLSGVMARERFDAAGFIANFDDEAIKLKSGVQTTMRDLMEKTGSFKLSPEEAQAIDVLKASRKSAYDTALRHVENFYLDEGLKPQEAAARARDVVRTTPLEEGQDYWPRMAAAVGEKERALRQPSFFRGGAQAPNIDLPREAVFPGGAVKFSGDAPAVYSRYVQQLFYRVQRETVIKPLMKRLGIDPKTVIPTQLRAAVDAQTMRRGWLADVNKLLGQASGLSGKQLQQRVSTLAAADVPDEYRGLLSRLETPEIVEAPTTRGLADRAQKAATEAARGAEPPPPARRPLKQAAEAAIASEKGTEGVKAVKAAVAAVRKDLKVLRAANSWQLREAQRQLRLGQKVAKGDLRRLRTDMFPDITELFEAEDVARIEQAFSRLDPNSVPGFLAAMNNWVGVGIGVQAGSFDIGFISLQMLPGLAANPLAIPSIFARMTNNRAYLGALTKLQQGTFRDGKPMLQTMLGHNLRLVSEPLMPDIMAIKPGTVASKVSHTVQNWPLNRMFSRGINLSRMNIAKYGVKLLEAVGRRPLTSKEYRSVMSVANTVTGDFNWTRAGTGQVQRALERVGLRYAPSWLRANLRWLALAAHPNVSVEANLARLALANTVGTVIGLYSLGALMMGQTPNLDIRDTGKFLTVRVAGARVGPGGVMVQVARTVGKAYTLAETAATADTPEERAKARKALLDIREGRNPIRQFWRAGAPAIGGLVYDLAVNEGVQSYTQKPINLSPEGIQTIAESAVLPFAAQSLASEEGATGFFGTFLGGRAFPVSPVETFIETADAKAQSAGFRDWESTPKATQAELLRSNADLKAAQDARTAYFERFPGKQSQEDFVFDQVDKSRKMTEETLLGLWGAVQRGERDISTFREAYSDLMMQHGALSSRLMDGLDTDLKKRSTETNQDYYARMYHSIQPELFDGKALPGDFQDGVISPSEWEMWRQERDAFYRKFPEAAKHRDYIETEYPTRNWESQEMADVHRLKSQMNQSYQQFLDIPKYRGVSAEGGNFIDSVIGLADRKVREVKFELAQRGVDVSKVRIPAKVAWSMVIEDLRGANLTAEQVEWLKVAVLMDRKQDMRRKMLSSERARFLLDTPDLASWYPSAYADAGLRDEDIARLGFEQAPLGTSVQQRIASVA